MCPQSTALLSGVSVATRRETPRVRKIQPPRRSRPYQETEHHDPRILRSSVWRRKDHRCRVSPTTPYELAVPSRRAVTLVPSEGRGREDGATRAGARDSVGCSGDQPEADDHRRDQVHDTGVDGADGPVPGRPILRFHLRMPLGAMSSSRSSSAAASHPYDALDRRRLNSVVKTRRPSALRRCGGCRHSLARVETRVETLDAAPRERHPPVRRVQQGTGRRAL